MQMLYSVRTDSCYIEGVSPNIPDDAVPVDFDNYVKYWCGDLPVGKRIGWDPGKKEFIWVDEDTILFNVLLERVKYRVISEYEGLLYSSFKSGNIEYLADKDNQLAILKASHHGSGYVRTKNGIINLVPTLADNVFKDLMKFSASLGGRLDSALKSIENATTNDHLEVVKL